MAHLPIVTLAIFVAVFAVSSFAQRQFQQQNFVQRPQVQSVSQVPQQYQPTPQTAPRVFSGSCPDKNGRYPVPSQCDAYVECIDGVPEEKLCPEGLLFNPDARFNYPCGYPIDVNCDGRRSVQPPQPTEDCPHQFGYFKVGDSVNCGKFMNCADGKGYVFDCPEGLAFNAESYRCDWPDQVADCDAEAYLGFRCPPPGEGIFGPGEIRYFRSPQDCQRYFICVDNRPRLQNCGEGNAFSEDINACDAAENVTGCEPAGSLLGRGAGQVKLF
ncbi:protein obstructor-E-like [Diprion similis]|uniref:protein obstructor-E-like n=1 Tax=Diprion similis TaxID=362088 RepID=UPI001EF8A3BB|nr:protein obstructor-E-like [Diprion similis]